jgi:hypothetical protein
MNKPDPRNMNDLIQKASQQLGTSSGELKRQIDNGKLDEIMKKLPPQQAQNFQNILNNPELAKKLMDTPQAKMLMKKFFNS